MLLAYLKKIANATIDNVTLMLVPCVMAALFPWPPELPPNPPAEFQAVPEAEARPVAAVRRWCTIYTVPRPMSAFLNRFGSAHARVCVMY